MKTTEFIPDEDGATMLHVRSVQMRPEHETMNRSTLGGTRDLWLGLLLIAVAIVVVSVPFYIGAPLELRGLGGFLFGAISMSGYSLVERYIFVRNYDEFKPRRVAEDDDVSG